MGRSILFCIVAVLAVLGASLGVAYLKKIDRAELGIGDEAAERCTAPALQSFWRMIEHYPNYSAEQVVNYFGVFAAYAANAYTPAPDESFNLSEQSFAWKKHGDDIVRAGGFLAQVYYRETADRLLVMTVYRGTDSAFNVVDHISNASWFTQMLNPWDQYRTARQTFQQIRTEAEQAAAGRTIGYLTVGHSLGGGLARHIAKAFPCTTTIVFNSSFVTNEFRLAQVYDDAQVVDLFEREDPLTRTALYIKPDQFFKNNKSHQWYRLSNIEDRFDNQHGIAQAAVEMAGISLVCFTGEGKCGVAIKDTSGLPPMDSEIAYPRGLQDVAKLWCSTPKMKNKPGRCPAVEGATGQ